MRPSAPFLIFLAVVLAGIALVLLLVVAQVPVDALEALGIVALVVFAVGGGIAKMVASSRGSPTATSKLWALGGGFAIAGLVAGGALGGLLTSGGLHDDTIHSGSPYDGIFNFGIAILLGGITGAIAGAALAGAVGPSWLAARADAAECGVRLAPKE